MKVNYYADLLRLKEKYLMIIRQRTKVLGELVEKALKREDDIIEGLIQTESEQIMRLTAKVEAINECIQIIINN